MDADGSTLARSLLASGSWSGRVQVVDADAVHLVDVGEVAGGGRDAEVVAGRQDDARGGETLAPGAAVLHVRVDCGGEGGGGGGAPGNSAEESERGTGVMWWNGGE